MLVVLIVHQFVWIFFGEFDCFLLGELELCEDFFFIGEPSLLFFEGLDDFELLDVFLADAMIG